MQISERRDDGNGWWLQVVTDTSNHNKLSVLVPKISAGLKSFLEEYSISKFAHVYGKL